MADQFVSHLREPTFAPEPMSPQKPGTRSKDTEFAEFQTPFFQRSTQEQCDSECSTTCPSGATTFDPASPSPFGVGNMGRRSGTANFAELESLEELSEMNMSFQGFHAFFLPSASAKPWHDDPHVLPESRPSTPPVGVSAPGPLDTPPPAPNRREAAKPDLLRALTSQNLQAVQDVLADDPDAVIEPFWNQSCEPPLCCAIRLGCSCAIVAELISRGADVNVKDMYGCSPYALLQQAKAKHGTTGMPQYEWDLMAGLLLEAGAQTSEDNSYVGYVEADTWSADGDALLGAFLPPPMLFTAPPPMPLLY